MVRPALPLWRVLSLGLLSLAPVLFAGACGIRHEFLISGSAIESAGGSAYVTAVPSIENPFVQIDGDNPDNARRSKAVVFENGRRLGPPHRPHEYIRTDGRGQFSHWGSTLYFSASDNSDPRGNGRRYTIVTGATASRTTIATWLLALIASMAAGAWIGKRSGGLTVAPGTWVVLILVTCALYAAVFPSSIDPSAWGAARGLVRRVLWFSSFLASVVLAGLVGATADRRKLDDAREWSAWLSSSVARPFESAGWRGRTGRAASLAIPLLAFAGLVRYPFSPDTLLASYSSVLPIAATAGLALWCCHTRRDWLGSLAALTVTLALFAIPLAALWQHFAIHANAVGGLLPFSDASGYYYDARRLIDGHPLGWSARRPAFVGLLATLLAATGRNLIVCIAVLVALNGVATFLLARELRVTHGPGAGAAATLVLFLFYRIDGGLGTVLTENLGFAMGVIAFGALWRALRLEDLRGFWLGLGLLTVALLSRAGAFFVLPAFVVAGVWSFRRHQHWLRSAAGAAAAVAIASVLTIGIGRTLSDPAGSQAALSNFSYSLYGLVVGGEGWARVTVDHPNAKEGAEIYALAWQAFRSRPAGLVEGSLKMWGEYLLPYHPYHAFAFVRDPTYSRQLQLSCYALTAIGVIVGVRRYRQPAYALLVAGIAGHLASIPFVPPIDAGLRVYAATVPILAILVAVGIAAVLGWGARLPGLSRSGSSRAVDRTIVPISTPNPAVLGVALALVVFVGPVAVFHSSRLPQAPVHSCAGDSVSVVLRLSPGSYLRIVSRFPDVDDTRVMAPEVRELQLRDTVGLVELKHDADKLTAGSTLVNGYDLRSGKGVWLVAQTALLPPPPAVVEVCGHDSSDPLSKRYGLFYAESVQISPFLNSEF